MTTKYMHFLNKMENLYNRVFGLTGIIGSGKSTVANLLEKKGAVVISADKLSAFVLSPGYKNYDFIRNKIYKLVEENAGKDKADQVFQTDTINRRLLAEIIFADSQMTEKLNTIMHHEVALLFEQTVSSVSLNIRIIIYDVPLLFETGLNKKVKKNILVYTPEKTAIERASLRMGIPAEEIKKRLNRQICIEEKKGMADYVLDNSGDLNHLIKETEKLWSYLQDLE